MAENKEIKTPATKQQFDFVNRLRENNGEALLDIKDFNFDNPNNTADELEKERLAKLELEKNNPTDKTPEKIKAEQDAAEQLELEKQKAGETIKIKSKKSEPPAKVITASTEEDIEDDKLLKAFNKKYGKDFKSLDEIHQEPPAATPTKEEIEKQKEQREADKVAFGLKQGIIKPKQYESYLQDISNREEVAFQQYFAEQLTEDSNLTEKDARVEFNEKFGLESDKDSRQYKRGQKEIGILTDNIIRHTYADILSLDAKYEAHENSEKSSREITQSITSKVPEYTKAVKNAIAAVKKGRVDLGETGVFEYEVEDEVLAEYENELLSNERTAKSIQNGYTEKSLIDTINGAIKVSNFDSLVAGVVEQAFIKREKGLKGVVPARNFNARAVQNDIQKENLKNLRATLDMQEN